MKNLVKKLSLLVVAVALCVGMSAVSAEAATSVKISSASMKTDNGGDFVKGVSKANIKFKISGKKSDVTVNVINRDGKVVFKKTLKSCATGKEYKVTWNGKNTAGTSYVKEGYYCAKIVAGKTSKKTSELKFIVKSDFAGGDGSSKYPYKVSNTTQLKAVAKHNGRNFVQTKGINFNGKACAGLFTNDNPFTGTYDGKKYSISNISNVGSADYVGIFRAVATKGVIKNVYVKDSTFTGNQYVAAIVGINYGKVQDCKVTNCIVTGTKFDVAAIVGNNNKGKIVRCSSANNTVSSLSSLGAIAGYSNGSVTGCTSKKDIVASSCNGSNDVFIGGVVGFNEGVIDDCTVTEDTVNANCWYGYAGGVAGRNTSVIKNCTVYDEKKQIYGKNRSGGIVGNNSGVVANNTYYGDLSQIG